MNYGSLYRHTFYYEDPRVEIFCKKKGLIRKKKDKGIRKRLGINASKKNFLMYFDKGRILGLFEKENPTDVSNLLLLIYIKQITEVIDEFKNKKVHFLIITDSKKHHFKCKDIKEKNEWIKTLNFFREYYKSEKPEKEEEEKKSEDPEKAELESLIRISAEIEKSNFDKIKSKFDHTHFIKDKELDKIFEENSIEILRNRLLISSITKETKKIKKKKIEEPNTPKTPLTPFNREQLKDRFNINRLKNLTGSFYYIILISERPLHIIDEEFAINDNFILKKKTLPNWMHFNKIYFYEYQRNGDISKFKKVTPISDIESIICDKDNFCLKVKLVDKFYIMNFKSSWEVIMWMEGVRAAKETCDDLRRTKFGVIKFNVGYLYFCFNSHQDDEVLRVVRGIVGELTMDGSVFDFRKKILKVGTEFNYFCDAFYAHKPFLVVLFRFCVLNFHKAFREKVHRYWNDNFRTMNSAGIIGFASEFWNYLQIFHSWGLRDKNLNWIKNVTKTFIYVLFKKCKNVLVKILIDLKSKFFYDNKKIMSKSSENIEGHLYFIFENYDKIPDIETADTLVDMCGMILLTFLINLKNILKREKLKYEIYVAILNNRYQKIIRNFLKKVHRATKSRISLKLAKQMVNENFLLCLIIEIEKICYTNISRKINKDVKKFLLSKGVFLKLDFVENCKNCLEIIKPQLDAIEQKNYIGDLYSDIFNKFTKIYYRMFLNYCKYIKDDNYKELEIKMKKDKVDFSVYSKQYVPKKSNLYNFRIDQLYKFFISNDIDEVTINIMNMNVFYSKIIEENNLDILFKSKIFFPKKSINFIFDYLKNALIEDTNKTEKKEEIFLPLNPNVYIFIRNLKKKIFLKYEKTKTLIDRKSLYINITKKDEEKQRNRPTYEKIYKTKGFAHVLKFKNKIDDLEVEKYIKRKLVNEKQLKKYFFFFKKGVLLISKDEGAKSIIEGPSYKTITCINMLSISSFYFKTPTNGYVLFFKNSVPANCQKWFNYFILLKEKEEEGLNDLKKIDLSGDLKSLFWNFKKVRYRFDFEKEKEKDKKGKDSFEIYNVM